MAQFEGISSTEDWDIIQEELSDLGDQINKKGMEHAFQRVEGQAVVGFQQESLL